MVFDVAAELSRMSLFAGLPERALSELASRAIRRKWPSGSIIFSQGEPGHRCYSIVSGTLKVSAWTPEGHETILALLGPGDVVGELALFDSRPRSADAIALTDVEAVSVDGRVVAEVIASHPDVAIAILRVLSERIRATNEALQDAASCDVTARVARRLTSLAGRHGRRTSTGTEIDVPLSQDMLASMVGASRESVNKAVSTLTRDGMLTRSGRRYTLPAAGMLEPQA